MYELLIYMYELLIYMYELLTSDVHKNNVHITVYTPTLNPFLFAALILLNLPAYGVATISRLLKILGLFSRISSLL